MVGLEPRGGLNQRTRWFGETEESQSTGRNEGYRNDNACVGTMEDLGLVATEGVSHLILFELVLVVRGRFGEEFLALRPGTGEVSRGRKCILVDYPPCCSTVEGVAKVAQGGEDRDETFRRGGVGYKGSRSGRGLLSCFLRGVSEGRGLAMTFGILLWGF